MCGPPPLYSPDRIRSTCQRDQATEQPSRNNKQTNEGTNQPQPKKERGGSPSGGCVCIVGVDSPQPSLVTSVSSREAKPTRTKRKRNRDKKHKEAPHKHKKKPSQQGGGKPTNQTGQKAARRAEPNKEEKGRGEEGKRRPAERKERTPGKAAGAGGRKLHRPRRRARAALAVS